MEMYRIDSKIKDIYASPIGRDVINKLLLQLKLPRKAIENPLVGNLSLQRIQKLSKGKLSDGFVLTFLRLLNHETELPSDGNCEGKKAWWKEAVFYQIYPRSFCDGNGDGMGDLKGILSKLDYLESLGVDVLWLSPIYESPQDDNGYDISDYQKIWSKFGTMEEFDLLLAEVHRRGMRLIMDLVVNHTSDEHPWFLNAVANPDGPFHQYYMFRKGTADTPPNNWKSFFGGSAWNYYPSIGEWGLHLFSKKQMDLNWDEPALRNEIIKMIRWWLEKGGDGFRMDVINVISKADGLPNGDEMIGEMMGIRGIEHYFYGPRLHEYLREIRREAFEPFQAFSVGEMPGIGMETGKLLTGDDRGELDMFFCFDHLETPGHTRFDDYAYDLNELKKYYVNWQTNFGNHCWQSLFLENHDNPRFTSKVERNTAFHEKLATLLLTMQLTLKGSPFLYQGQEMGLGNLDFHSIDELQDIESKNRFKEFCERMPGEEALQMVIYGSRDHARAMLPWESADPETKARAQKVSAYLGKLTKLRRAQEALIYGDVIFTNIKRKNLFTYFRDDGNGKWYVEMNLSNADVRRSGKDITKEQIDTCRALGNYENIRSGILRPYEVNLYRLDRED